MILALAAILIFSGVIFKGRAAEQLIRTNQPGRMITKENDVEYLAPRQPSVPAPTNQFLDFEDALRTLAFSRATIRLADWSELHMKDHSRLEIIRRPEDSNAPSIRLLDGQIYLSSRSPGEKSIPIETPHARGIPKGTEFLVVVDAAANRTEVTMFDGEVELSNNVSTQRVTSGYQGIAIPGQEIQLRPVLEAKNIVQ